MDDRLSESQEPDIAIIGMACRFPGANDIDEFWDNLRAGRETISFFSDEELQAAGVANELLNDPNYVKASPVLDGHEKFDAHFFGVSPHEAEGMDPQHRVFLEVALTSLEDAGYDPFRFDGRIGIYAGSAMNTYILSSSLASRFAEEYLPTLIGSDKDFLATRVSYKLNLTGPSVTVQTACSTSLVAVHLACQSLLNEECDLCLAGGVSVRVPQVVGYLHEQGGVTSPDGHCRPFDVGANGTLFGSGAGIVVLKRNEDALRDGDHVYALIKGSAINNDGATKADFTAPSVARQSAVITEALAVAAVDARTITYVEAHGTGTYLGDPIEVEALSRAFRADTDKVGFCTLGSVKGNVGHLDTAAGVTGLMKTALAMKYRLLPPTVNYSQPNPTIDFGATPFVVRGDLCEWRASSTPRRAGVSSLGIGGTNAHVVLEEAPAPRPAPPSSDRRPEVLVRSAKTEDALETGASLLAEHLRTHDDLELSDVAHTLQVGRAVHPYRSAVVCRNRHEAVALLARSDAARSLDGQADPSRAVVFMLPGGGVQYPGMGEDLYHSEPVFRRHVDHGLAVLRDHESINLRPLLYPTPDRVKEAAQALTRPSVQLPAILIVEYALSQLWISWGVKPAALVGHSLGENAAACVAGVFSYESALGLASLRGRLFERLPEGGMLSVPLAPESLQPYLGNDLDLASINAPEHCVASGPVAAIERLEAQLRERDIDTSRIWISVAAHSRMLDAILDEFRAYVHGMELRPPDVPIASNRSGNWMTPSEATSPDYWVEHLRHTVQMSECFRLVLGQGRPLFVEVGPGRSLSTFGRLQAPDMPSSSFVQSLPGPRESTPAAEMVPNAVGRLWAAGLEIDWHTFNRGRELKRVSLPTYPFDRKRFWLETQREPATRTGVEDLPDSLAMKQLKAGNLQAILKTLESESRIPADLSARVPEVLNALVDVHRQQLSNKDIAQICYDIGWIRRNRHDLPPAEFLPSPEAIGSRLIPRVTAAMNGTELQTIKDLTAALEDISLEFVVNAFLGMGWLFKKHECFEMSVLAQRMMVKREHRRFLGRLLEMLEEGGILRRQNDAWEVIREPEPTAPSQRLQSLSVEYPQAHIELALLERSGSRLAEVLQGRCDPLELLFPDGEFGSATAFYQDSVVFRTMNDNLREAIGWAVKHLPTGRTIQVLEIGGGTGGTTAHVLPKFPGLRTRYVFTDVSPLFTSKAEERFGEYEFFETSLLDAGKDPSEQGFEPHSFDLVIASNCLHATSDMKTTMGHVRKLLAPGGLLILMEGVRPLRWIDLFAGGLEGWWMFEDTTLRPSHPLLSVGNWRDLLEDSGFGEIGVLDPSEIREGGLYQQALLFARADGLSSRDDYIAQGLWLILADPNGTGANVANVLSAQGARCIVAQPDRGYRAVGDGVYTVDPERPDDLRKLLEDEQVDDLRGVLYLWGIDHRSDLESTDTEQIGSTTRAVCRNVVNLIKGLSAAGMLVDLPIWLITRGAQPVRPDSAVPGLSYAPLWGIGRVIGLEHPDVSCRRLDLDPRARETDAQAVVDELTASDGEDQVAYRDHVRYVARLRPWDGPKRAVPLRMDPDATYLVTGGVGGVGLLTAEWMTRRGARHLLLTSRSGVKPEARAAIERLRKDGVRVVTVQSDVSDHEDVRQLMEETLVSMPTLKGIIHSAMVLDDGILLNQDPSRFERVLAPKLDGAWNLHRWTSDRSLDFFVLYSSITYVLGNPGQSNYAAANAFLHALSQHRRAKGLPGLCVSWAFTENVGEAAHRVPEEVERMKQLGIDALSADQGLRILEHALSDSDLAHVGMLPVDWNTYCEQPIFGRSSLLKDLTTPATPDQKAKRDERSDTRDWSQLLRSASEASRAQVLTEYLTVQVADSLGMVASELDVQKPLIDLGLDSLMAVGLRNRVRRDVELDFDMSVLMVGSVVSLATTLGKQKDPPAAVTMESHS